MRQTNRLTARTIATLNKPGRYGDGRGLWLQVSPAGTKSWLYRFMLNGRARQMGLGPAHTVSLADARAKANQCRNLLLEGKDPIESRRAERSKARIDDARALTFKACAGKYIAAHEAGWRNEKHRAQWRSTLETYAYPAFGDLPVAAIDTALVLKSLEPIWTEKPETAGRVRGRIESVLDWAAARGYRERENPARWRGHLDKLLPQRRRIARVQHHPALPYADLPGFMAQLRGQEGTSARALEFLILTATRTSEVVGARWAEVDLDERTWTIPGERMKSGRSHRVPLSDRAIDILKALPADEGAEFVFVGAQEGKPLSNMALLMTLRRMGRNGLTVHGFRSTFRDWSAETTAYPREVAEMALAHVVSDQVEAAYRRGDLFQKRRRLMADWARYAASPPRRNGEVVPMQRRG